MTSIDMMNSQRVILEKANFEGTEVKVMMSKFIDGESWKIYSFSKEDGGTYMPYAVHTVNFPNVLKKGEVAISEYAEGIGSLAFLFAYDIISHPHALIDSGHVKLPVCKLLIEH